MNIPSNYQEELFRALVLTGQVDLQVIYSKPITSDRLELGWKISLEGYQYTYLHNPFKISNILHLAWHNRNRINIVNGIWSELPMTIVSLLLRVFNRPYFVYSEAVNPLRKRSRKKLLFKWLIGSIVARHSQTRLLAISHLSSDFYQRIGFTVARTYDFGYFRSKIDSGKFSKRKSESEITFIYVGQLIYRKGIDILIEAILPLFDDFPHLRLQLVGDGVDREPLERYIRSNPQANRVEFKGVISSLEVLEYIAQADILILPSRFDGWGLVINEAFSVGIPVIVSDMCGGADLVVPGTNGYIFESGQVESLRRVMLKFISSSVADRLRMSLSAGRTGSLISTDVVVPYLLDCIRHVIDQGCTAKPIPPWVSGGSSVNRGNTNSD